MSSITPPSFVDDGTSFQKRVPHRPHPAHIADWIDSTGSDTLTYTGSFVDDGADMLHPINQAPGFGPIDPRFYKQRKRKDAKDGVWNDDIQRAVAGDMQRSLARLRGIGNVEVKKPSDVIDKGKKKDTVTVPVPPKWGTFVIKGDDGRVIVVGEDGEFDSGVKAKDGDEQLGKWVKAPTTVSVVSKPAPKLSRSKHGKSRSKKDLLQSPIKELTAIPESEYEDIHQPSVVGKDLGSPTGFFMTGGASGWPSRAATSVASPAKSKLVSRHSSTASPVKLASSTHSPPGAWPSPLPSPTRSTIVSERSSTKKASVNSWGERHSHRSDKSDKSWKKDVDTVSVRSHSTYKPVTVEDAADTSSSEILKPVHDVEWGGSHAGSAKSWAGSKKSSQRSNSSEKKASVSGWESSPQGSVKSSRHSTKAPNSHAWTNLQPTNAEPFAAPASLQNWVGARLETVSSASDTSTRRTRRQRSQSHRSHSHAPSEQQWSGSEQYDDRLSEVTWDGYEKTKTLSDVSVVGTGSERSSRAPSQHSQRSHETHRSHKSHRSSTHGAPENWTGSEHSWAQSQKANVDGWGGEETDGDGEGGWSGSQEGRGEGSRLSNGYDEDNETYLNEDWSGVKVRVRSRRVSGSGWD